MGRFDTQIDGGIESIESMTESLQMHPGLANVSLTRKPKNLDAGGNVQAYLLCHTENYIIITMYADSISTFRRKRPSFTQFTIWMYVF